MVNYEVSLMSCFDSNFRINFGKMSFTFDVFTFQSKSEDICIAQVMF